MKKILLLIIAALLLSGCSRSQYDALLEDYMPAETEAGSSLSDHIESTDANDLFISKWGYSMFQDNAKPYLIDNDKVGLMVNVGNATENDIDNFWSTLRINLQTISVLKDNDDYPYMYINAVTSDNIPVMDVFIDVSDIEDISISFTTNADYDEYIKSSILDMENALSK